MGSVIDQLLPEILVSKAREVVNANRAAGRRVTVAEKLHRRPGERGSD